jgi:hypothetical protein
MTDSPHNPGVIRRDSVRIVRQPALVDCGSATAHGQGTLAVVPLMDGDRVAGFEIRCGCGANAIVECVYPTES